MGPVEKEIGKNIVLLRQACGMTQEEVAHRANISVHCLQMIEHGHWNVTIDSLMHLSQVFGVDARVLSFFSKSDEDILSEISKVPRLAEETGDILQVCRSIALLRKEAGITQKELAQKARISTARLREIEHGCANTTIKRILRIAQSFGMSLAMLSSINMSEEVHMDLVREAREAAGLRPKL